VATCRELEGRSGGGLGRWVGPSFTRDRLNGTRKMAEGSLRPRGKKGELSRREKKKGGSLYECEARK